VLVGEPLTLSVLSALDEYIYGLIWPDVQTITAEALNHLQCRPPTPRSLVFAVVSVSVAARLCTLLPGRALGMDRQDIDACL
jgi:hypothetical protein